MGKGEGIKPTDVDIAEELLGGVYANSVVVRHSREEFVLDFLGIFPPRGRVAARVVIGPGHMKRIVEELHSNLKKYEATYGELKEALEPATGRKRIALPK